MSQGASGIGGEGIGGAPIGAGYFEYAGAVSISALPTSSYELAEYAQNYDYDGAVSLSVNPASSYSYSANLDISDTLNSYFHPEMELSIVN